MKEEFCLTPDPKTGSARKISRRKNRLQFIHEAHPINRFVARDRRKKSPPVFAQNSIRETARTIRRKPRKKKAFVPPKK
jgi:hypothetical protein